MMKKYIVGLGCSWTQGEGGYTEEIWKAHGGRVQVRGKDDYYLRQVEHEHSWVNVLCRDHFPEYQAVNLGARGIGNTAAVHQLHFCDKIDWHNSTGIIILMLSGFERLDFIQPTPFNVDGQDDFYSNNTYKHYKYKTLWPFPAEKDNPSRLQDGYFYELWSEEFTALTGMMAILNAKTFAESHGYKFIVANAFNQRDGKHSKGLKSWLEEYAPKIVDKFDWSNYLH